MSQNRSRSRAAYGGPEDEKEVVVTLDRRLLIGVAVVAVFGVALAAGMLANRGGGSEAVTSATGGVPPQATTLPLGVGDAAARAQAVALGLPTSVQIVETIVEQTTPVAGDVAGAPQAVQDAVDLLGEGNSVDLPIDEISPKARENAEKWTPDVLAESIEDPNLAEPYRPYKVEDYTEPVPGGPKLAVKDLNKLWSYNFGDVDKNTKVSRDFVVKNVGDADLIISRVYTGCGCTTTKIGDIPIDGAGNLPSPLTLKPWQEIPFTVEFDARLSQEGPVSLAKFIQIFSNDPTKAVFDDAAPELTHETRFRIVVRPLPAGQLVTPSDDAKKATAEAAK
ncbi:MAG: DUF1573 domain-containing protein [Ardenticatenales bacterium]|nr:DUF1573 domain-containing protein [Ardenticatenales bacterium]